jgi:hypothetical protein
MAKPKFELTADLVRVEPEPQPMPNNIVEKTVAPATVLQQQFIQHRPEVLNYNAISNKTVVTQNETPSKPKEERQSMSLFISKDLKKSFHLHCVQNGLSMTDAIEVAIANYLESNR